MSASIRKRRLRRFGAGVFLYGDGGRVKSEE